MKNSFKIPAPLKEYLKEMDVAQMRYVVRILQGFCKFFEGTGIIDVEKCVEKVREIYGPYLEALERERNAEEKS